MVITMENGYLQWIFPLNMVIFHSYVTNYQRVPPKSGLKYGKYGKYGTNMPPSYDPGIPIDQRSQMTGFMGMGIYDWDEWDMVVT